MQKLSLFHFWMFQAVFPSADSTTWYHLRAACYQIIIYNKWSPTDSFFLSSNQIAPHVLIRSPHGISDRHLELKSWNFAWLTIIQFLNKNNLPTCQSGRYKNEWPLERKRSWNQRVLKIKTLEDTDPRTARLVRFLYLFTPYSYP